MKTLAVVFALVGATANAAPPPPPPAPPPDLRRSLQQYHEVSGTTARRLTPAERAELRRQLSEFGPPPAQPSQQRR
jgi:hypothetical protein